MKKTLAVIGVLLLTFSALSFADAPTIGKGEARKFSGENATIGRGEQKKLQNDQIREEKKELGIFLKYAPEIYEEQLALKSEHIQIHEAIQAIKTVLKDFRKSTKTDRQNFVEALKVEFSEAVKIGELTQEEAKSAIKEKVKETFGEGLMMAYKEDIATIREQLLFNRKARETKRLELRTALKAGDLDSVHSLLLLELAVLRAEHVKGDQEILNILQQIQADLS